MENSRENPSADLNRTAVLCRGFPLYLIILQTLLQHIEIKRRIVGGQDAAAHQRFNLLPQPGKVGAEATVLSLIPVNLVLNASKNVSGLT